MKYNKSEIMKSAWNLYRASLKWVCSLTFAECLRRAWANAKKNARKFAGYVNIQSVNGNIEVTVLTGVVTGKTYSWRKTLKEFGAVWCSGERYWALPVDRVQDFCRKYA